MNVDGVLVLYAAVGGALRLIGLNPVSGATLWSLPASRGSNSPGEPPALAVSGGEVVYLGAAAGAPRGVAVVAAVDARSGRLLWRSGRGLFSADPIFCPDEPTVICTTGRAFVGSTQQGVEFRFNVRTGRELGMVVLASDKHVRLIGFGLFDLGLASPPMLGAASGAKLAWQQKLQTVFPLPGGSTEWGWDFDRVERVGLFVGGPGWPPIVATSQITVFSLERAMTAGFAISDGASAWSNAASTYACNNLPCPGAPLSDVSRPRPLPGPAIGLRLRAAGFESYAPGQLGPKFSPNTSVSLEGFDPASGQTLWSFDAGRNIGLIRQTLLPALLGPETILLYDPDGHLQKLQLTDGSHHPAPAASTGWCRITKSYYQRIGFKSASGGPLNHLYNGQYALFPCNGATHRTRIPERTPAFVGQIGAHVDGLIIWADELGLFARPAAP